ncbi:hypothetical protein HD553DRAFT_312128 [Filobasidium floriforme]|uniref:uncharacterized protein n=1 Tax=Filobasidium floriforme TaxID=5210 RepID=UPI001E8E3A28|nr:uncharacterized protein HD553DRAFT_312128 [Filobasidium floriforme]KAH8084118.1 hypothetical protein HD553DRAFT_312128 [Filobasidium floriforme]
MEHTAYQALQWDFPDVLPPTDLAPIPSESSTSYLRAAHRQHQIALQNAQKRTRTARDKLDHAQMRLKRLRREKEGLQGKRTRMARQAGSLEDQVNAINPAILQREVDETTIENLPSKDDPTRSHLVLLARLEQEIEAVQTKESSLKDLGNQLSGLKTSITEIRHKSIIVDGGLGELDKVAQQVRLLLEDPVLTPVVDTGSDAEKEEDEGQASQMTTDAV